MPRADGRLEFARAWAAGSAYYRRMGIAVQGLEEGQSRLRLLAEEHHLNSDGILHGGVLPALADAAMGTAARTVHGAAAQLLTSESNIRYLRPAAGGEILALGRVVKAGRTLIVTEAEMSDAEGALLAKAGATFVVRAVGDDA
jgi:uncharacterized protein (TIGR00369 family)